ncbi:MAG: molecular chaperone HtpG [Polyangiaceae bacterium]|nr:molecular chaperone HtpG [Polyangiaceae bacterium]
MSESVPTPEAGAAAPGATEFEFKAQVQQLLSLVVHSLYTNREVFLRELVSNASDALDKARLLELTDSDVADRGGEPCIRISIDKPNHTISIEDNGIGMTRDEVILNLGTIAHSGTAEFLKKYAEAMKKGESEAASLIGQFGVGFYAAFMVANRVDVHTRSLRKDGEAVLWRSTGEGTFTVVPGDRETPGTRIVLHVKEDASEFLEDWRLEGVIKKYSDFVMFPIELDGKVANRSSALWRLPKAKVSAEQHAEFFKHLTGGELGATPLLTLHYAAEAPVQFHALLYVPEKATPDLFLLRKERPGLRLYAKRVLIMESCELLTASYLRFVRGVVDSEDLSLNVSRELLQEDRTAKQIEQQVTRQVLKALQELADEDAERYGKLWKAFGVVLKEGVASDWKNKDALVALCRFESLKHKPGELVSLKQYLGERGAGQEAIYYITGPSREQLVESPHLEVFKKRGIDVLLLSDPIDEWLVKSVSEFDKVPLRSAAHGDLELGSDEPARDAGQKDALEAAAKAVAAALGDKVAEVRLSKRLTETASCLVSREGDPGAHFERIMKMLDETAAQKKRVLELNPDHPFVKNLATLVARDPQASHIALWAEMLYDQALLSEGVVPEPRKLVKRIEDLLVEVSRARVGS